VRPATRPPRPCGLSSPPPLARDRVLRELPQEQSSRSRRLPPLRHAFPDTGAKGHRNLRLVRTLTRSVSEEESPIDARCSSPPFTPGLVLSQREAQYSSACARRRRRPGLGAPHSLVSVSKTSGDS